MDNILKSPLSLSGMLTDSAVVEPKHRPVLELSTYSTDVQKVLGPATPKGMRHAESLDRHQLARGL